LIGIFQVVIGLAGSPNILPGEEFPGVEFHVIRLAG
jgi:hypothetical protein